MLWVLAIFLPPLAVLFTGKVGKFFLNCLLCLLFYFPGIIHALAVVSNYERDKANRKLAGNISNGFNQVIPASTVPSHLQSISQTKNAPVNQLNALVELEKYDELRKKGIITEEEFQQKKRQALRS